MFGLLNCICILDFGEKLNFDQCEMWGFFLACVGRFYENAVGTFLFLVVKMENVDLF